MTKENLNLKHSLYLIIALCFINLSTLAHAHKSHAVHLTESVWEIHGIDQKGASWKGSNMYFLKQIHVRNEIYKINGLINWFSSQGHYGIEIIEGKYDANNKRLEFKGTQLVNSKGIVKSQYSAELSEDGERIINGTWLDDDQINWGAIRHHIEGP